MKKVISSLTLLLISGIFLLACSKKETSQIEKEAPFSTLYKNGGIVHNELLSAFLDTLIKNDSKLSQKLKSIALNYPQLQKSNGNIETKAMSNSKKFNTTEFTQLRDEINKVVADEVLPISISYLLQNGYYAGIDNPQFFVNEVVKGIYKNPTFSNDEYLNALISANSLSFRNFVPALKSLIENERTSSDLFSKIDALKDSYLIQTTDEIEALAIINGCETAKASFSYWNDPVNTTNWDETILYSFNFGTLSNNAKTLKTDPERGRTEIIVADALGAVAGVVQGARIGALAGPGGAMIVGITGMVLRGAHASAGDYCKTKILDWLGW